MTEESTVLETEEVETETPAEIETPEAEAEEAETEEVAEQEEEAESEEDEVEPEYDEFDFGGNKMQLPKGSVPDELRDQIDKFTKGTWGDYTRKSQEIAERVKAIEAREGAVEKLQALSGETLDTYSRGLQIKQEIEQLSQVNLNALWQSDPDQARRVSDALSQKQAEFQNIVARVNQQEQALTQAQQAELARRMDEGKQSVEKRIKGFEAKAPEVVDYVVKEYGLTREEAETWPLNPKTAEMAYKAMMFDRMQAKAGKPAQKQPAKPVKSMKGKGGQGQKSISDMEMDEYVAYRAKGGT